jgi:hypothetical protein
MLPVHLALLLVPFTASAPLEIVNDVDVVALRAQAAELRAALTSHGAVPPSLAELPGPDATADDLQQRLDPLCLVAVSINPESRVKAARGPAPAVLQLGQESILLVKVHNEAGLTHALTVTGAQLKSSGGWLSARVQPVSGKSLSGRKLDYLLLRLGPSEVGKREATLQFDAGQGTQDLGFRAEVPVLFTVRPRR